jgi:hypothetical protein
MFVIAVDQCTDLNLLHLFMLWTSEVLPRYFPIIREGSDFQTVKHADENMQAFLAFDFDNNAGFKAHLNNIELPPKNSDTALRKV